MKYNQLGKTDIQVSEICLGTMTFGQQNTEAEGHQQLNYALTNGVNFIDTAEMYAIPRNKNTVFTTEKIIGTWLSQRTDRDQIILATKIAGPAPNLSYIRNPLDFSASSIQSAIEESLRRLQTGYIDLYQLHWPERSVNNFSIRDYPFEEEDKWENNFLEILQALQQQVQKGNIRHFGLSNETPWGTMNFLNLAENYQLPRPVSIQNPYNLLNRTFEIGLSEIAHREKIGLLAYSPMAFGLLSGKYHYKTDTPDNRLNQFKSMARYQRPQAYVATRRYLEIAEKWAIPPAQLALAFVNSRPFVSSNIIGATNMQQLQENIQSVEITITPAIEQAINAVHDDIPNPAP